MWCFEIINKATDIHNMIAGHDFEEACKDAGLDPNEVRKNYWIYSSYED